MSKPFGNLREFVDAANAADDRRCEPGERFEALMRLEDEPRPPIPRGEGIVYINGKALHATNVQFEEGEPEGDD